jgi:CheY-like chemotaxis protein
MAGPKILLADESEIFLEMAQGYLKETNAVVLTASTGDEALNLARRGRPHLAFLSLGLQGIDGAVCCMSMKSDPVLAAIPVIIVVAKKSAEATRRCRSAGCDAILGKPVDRKTFLETGHGFISAIERRERRISCRATVAYRRMGKTGYGTLEDIGEHGMFVGCSSRCRSGEILPMSFLLPGNDTLVRVIARVAWQNVPSRKKKRDLPQGFGVEFVDVLDDGREEIREYLDHTELRHRHLSDSLVSIGSTWEEALSGRAKPSLRRRE